MDEIQLTWSFGEGQPQFFPAVLNWKTTPPDQAYTAPFHGVLENMENVGSGVSLLESGAAYRNRTDT
jgi:hypothetical protein